MEQSPGQAGDIDSLDILMSLVEGKDAGNIFQRRWLQDYKWLRYGVHKDYQGGRCLPCILFLSINKKENLCAHHLQTTTNLRNYVKGMPKRSIICVQWIVHMISRRDG